jgi:hypothetical protein
MPEYALVVWGFYPLWLVAGGIDYLCHRRSRIEHTAGLEESHLHLAQFASMVLLVVTTAAFTLRGAVLILAALLLVAHTVLSYLDVRYSQPRRHVSALEQHVHAFLVVLPITAVALLAVLDAQLDAGDAAVSSRQPELSARQFGALLLSLLLLGGLPLLEEWWRSRRVRTKASSMSNGATLA